MSNWVVFIVMFCLSLVCLDCCVCWHGPLRSRSRSSCWSALVHRNGCVEDYPVSILCSECHEYCKTPFTRHMYILIGHY